jgi:hypothetical protein
MNARKLADDFGSINWAMRTGKESARVIRSIRAGGYKTARRHFEFYSDGRVAHGAARRALSSVKKIGNPKANYVGDDGHDGWMLYALNAGDSLREGRAVYWPMLRLGSRQGVA